MEDNYPLPRKSTSIESQKNANSTESDTITTSGAQHEPVLRYKYESLDPNEDQFRLLQFTRRPAGPITCAVHTYKRREAPGYTALSYVWGDADDTLDIYIDGHPLEVTTNLYSYLDIYARPHNPHLGSETDVEYLWIDQICINQSSKTERNHQVALMGSIFKEAVCVDAWLGPGYNGCAQAIEYILKANQKFSDLPSLRDSKEYYAKLTPEQKSRFNEHFSRYTDELHLTKQLFERPYWRRLWILQEFALARKLRLICGTNMLIWRDLFFFPRVYLLFGLIIGAKWVGNAFLQCAMRVWITRKSTGFPQFQILLLCSLLDCSYPRDQVYGLLGLCSDLRLHMQVDYSKTTQDIFWEAIAALSFETPEAEVDLELFNSLLFYRLGKKMGVAKEHLELYIRSKQTRLASEHGQNPDENDTDA